MMKVSDPIIFGHAVTVFFKDLFEKYATSIAELGVEPNNGLGDLLAKIDTLPADQKAALEADLVAAYAAGPDLAGRFRPGITNLHVPMIIIDASVPRFAPGSDVEQGRCATGHKFCHSRPFVCRGIRGDH